MCRTGKGNDTSIGKFGQGESSSKAMGPAPYAASREAAAADRSAPSPYLESSRSTVDGNASSVGTEISTDSQSELTEEVHFECRAVGCRSRFCPKCCVSLGLKLRNRLVPVLKTFSEIMMVTLTVDPKLFAGPAEAYWHVRKRRAIAELVRELKKAGHLKSGRYFYVVEFHKNGWAHFHLLLEADFIPFAELCRLWGRNRPKSAPAWKHSYAESLKGIEPEFGTCKISKGDKSQPFADAKHAACYALKYMMKQPENGFPQWVFDAMDAGSRIRLYESSRKLLPGKPTKKQEVEDVGEVAAGDEHPAECFCETCREATTPATVRIRKTVEQRLAECGKRAAVLEVTERKDTTGKVIASRRRFVRMLEMLFVDVLVMVGCEDADKRFVRLPEGDFLRFALHRGPRKSVIGGEVNSSEVARVAEFDAWNASGGVV